MADELAKITGTIHRNTASDADRVPWPGALVRAVPVQLDETAAISDSVSTPTALSDADGLVTLHLWPGAWRIILPDGEVIDGDGTGVVVEAGESYTLLGLRGYVAPPGTSVTTVQLPTGGASGQLLAKASEDDYDVEWQTAAGTGDMLAATYDPTGVAGDAFSMASMVEAADAKIMTAAERALLGQQSGTNTGDQDLSGYALTADLGDSAVLDVGTTTGTVAAGDDSRLSDARTPTAHASTHATGQSDALTPADIGAATAAQGGLADSAVQPGDLATVATTGAYSDLSGTPTLGTAAAEDATAFAAALGADDNYVTDAEKAALHSHANKSALDQVSGINTGDQDLSGLTPIAQPRNAQTGTAYTLVASDAGKIVTLDNAAAITVTVPASTIAVPADTVVRVDFLVLGAGLPTFVGSGGMTINADPSLVADAQYAGLSLLLLSATSGVLVGRLATP